MRVSLYPATCVASLIVLCASIVAAQGPAGTNRPSAPASGGAAPAPAARTVPNGTNVAVVDISYIFKNHNVFNTRLIELNERGAQLDGWVRAQQRELNKMKEELATFKAGSAEYQQLEEKMTKAIADNDLNLRRQRQDFLTDEARLYFETYSQIEQAIQRFALQANIGLVLRHSREPMKAEDPKSVMASISRMVVFQNRLDITDIILKQLNAGTTPPPAASKGGTTAPAEPLAPSATKSGTRPNTKLR
ncbi:MAG TPA: OmpH family outer membrane protein [Pirellulaceae bacterium]|nr:OmpH family outer membrane protein [Pirellulaceae bacterium]